MANFPVPGYPSIFIIQEDGGDLYYPLLGVTTVDKFTSALRRAEKDLKEFPDKIRDELEYIVPY